MRYSWIDNPAELCYEKGKKHINYNDFEKIKLSLTSYERRILDNEKEINGHDWIELLDEIYEKINKDYVENCMLEGRYFMSKKYKVVVFDDLMELAVNGENVCWFDDVFTQTCGFVDEKTGDKFFTIN